MKLTPLDIHHKEFRHSLRGYSEEEVDAFLDQVADEFERLFKENIDMSERLESANEKVKHYQDMERTLHNTMLAAQRSAEDIVSKAREEAATVLRDAEVKAKEIIHSALTNKQKVAGELVRIKQAEEEFRTRFTSMLEGHLRNVQEITLPEDVSVLAGQTDEGVVAEVEVATESALAALDEAMPPMPDVTAAAERVSDSFAGETQVMPTAVAPEPVAPAEQPAQDAAAFGAEPPESGFVSGVMLGETEEPELPVEVDLDDPKEFPMVSFESLGEREDDLDIEEID